MLSLHTISLRKKGTTPSDPRDDGDHLEPLNAFLPDNLSLVFWAMLASRYSKNPAVLYDLLNEPHERSRDAQFDAYYPEEIKTSDAASFADRWHVWVLRLSSTIRKIHPRALIFVSGSANNDGWASSLQYMPVYEGSAPIKNTVYSFHWYGSRKLDDIKGWTEFLTVDSGRSGPAKNLKTVNSAVPVFAGEWVLAPPTPFERM